MDEILFEKFKLPVDGKTHTPMTKKKLVLASQSPRRQEILRALNVPFNVIPAHVPETHPDDCPPSEVVLMHARNKAMEIARKTPLSYVIGADTIVFHNGEILTKPADYNEAKAYLSRLIGNTHTVYTGVVVVDSDTQRAERGIALTDVTFRALDKRFIDVYIRNVHPYDKAGGYAIQGLGSLVVERISGCYYNVMGLPVTVLDEVLLRFGVSLFDYVEAC